MVDALDSKSSSFNGVSVRVGPGAPICWPRRRAGDMLPPMDARTRKHEAEDDATDEARLIAETITVKRDRLLASLTLIAGIGLIVSIPFALRAGAEFFMPVTAALVVAIALVPLLEWFERRGVPSRLAAGLCLIIFLVIA